MFRKNKNATVALFLKDCLSLNADEIHCRLVKFDKNENLLRNAVPSMGWKNPFSFIQ